MHPDPQRDLALHKSGIEERNLYVPSNLAVYIGRSWDQFCCHERNLALFRRVVRILKIVSGVLIRMTEIETQLSAVGYHRQEAMHFADQAEALKEQIGPEGNANRELNQRIGVALKLADVHARLALAMSSGFRA